VTPKIGGNAASCNYEQHGHVGFAWGARRDVLSRCLLYDKALVGSGDHIMAHAAAGQMNHPCIEKVFKDDIEDIRRWSARFATATKTYVGYVPGDLYHIWHGDVEKRQYLKRTKEFTGKSKQITRKDKNGLYIAEKGHNVYVTNYFQQREVPPVTDDGSDMLTSAVAAYATDSATMGILAGGDPVGAILGASLADHERHERDQEARMQAILDQQRASEQRIMGALEHSTPPPPDIEAPPDVVPPVVPADGLLENPEAKADPGDDANFS
jgi:hypothetical protein